MICPYCRTRNDIGVRFCRKCGSNLQNLEDYTDYVGFGTRICAFSLDVLVTVVPAALILWIATGLSIIPILVILFVISWVYTAALESSSRQATLGKMVAGIRVVDAHGKRISFWTASVRHFAKLLIPGSFWYLVSFSEKKQAMHDMVANTYVVMEGPYSRDEPGYEPPHWYEAYKKR